MDIGTLSWRGVPLAWQSPSGFRSPALHDAEADGGYGFNRSLSGFLVTAGLDHVRHPRDRHPHHGRMPFTPARLIAAGEDWEAETPCLYCEGEIVQWIYGGEALRLVRRIEAPVGGASLRIRDRVESLSAEPQPMAILYHFNLGHPAIGRGSSVSLDGAVVLEPLAAFPEAGTAPATLHPCAGADGGRCVLATPHAGGELRATFAFGASTLPFLQLWRDLRPGRGIFSVEPCSAAGPSADGTPGQDLLSPGGSRCFDVAVELAGPPPDIAGER